MIGRLTAGFTATACAALALAMGAATAQAQNSKEWDELVKAAQAEGRVQVVLAGRMALTLRKAFPEFEKKYNIRVGTDTGGGREQIARILAERKVGRFTMDVRIGGANSANAELIPNNALSPVDELLILPDVTDQSKWFQGKHTYSDVAGRYVFTWGVSPTHVVTFNTKMVKPEEIQSYWDLLDPKWKGKIVAWSPATPGTIGTSGPMFLNPKIGAEWFRRFATETGAVFVKDSRQGAEWVALGRYPIGLFGMNQIATKLAAEGFPIQGFLPHPLKEGEMLSSSGANLMVMDRAPNPNAAKLFTNWALSREAQQMFMAVSETTDSLRRDVDNSVIAPQYRMDRNGNYLISFENPEYAAKTKEIMDTLRRIMREAGHQ